VTRIENVTDGKDIGSPLRWHDRRCTELQPPPFGVDDQSTKFEVVSFFVEFEVAVPRLTPAFW
jgi:hypothetical protein